MTSRYGNNLPGYTTTFPPTSTFYASSSTPIPRSSTSYAEMRPPPPQAYPSYVAAARDDSSLGRPPRVPPNPYTYDKAGLPLPAKQARDALKKEEQRKTAEKLKARNAFVEAKRNLKLEAQATFRSDRAKALEDQRIKEAAIKQQADDHAAQQRFIREARMTAAIAATNNSAQPVQFGYLLNRASERQSRSRFTAPTATAAALPPHLQTPPPPTPLPRSPTPAPSIHAPSRPPSRPASRPASRHSTPFVAALSELPLEEEMGDLDLEDAPNNPNLQVNENSNANAAVIRHAVFRSVRLMNLMEAIENNPVLAEFCNNDVRGLPSVHELEENRNNPDYASLLNGPCVNDLRNAENYANALSQVSDDPRYFDFSQVANNDLEALEQSAAQQAREAQNRFEEDWQQQQFPPGQ